MAYKRGYRKRPAYRRRGVRPSRKLQRTRKLVGQKPVTMAETLSSWAGPIGQIASTVGTIASLVNSEKHFIDVDLAGTANTSGGYGANLIPIATGDGENDRSGNSVLMKDVYLRACLDGGFTSLSVLGDTNVGYCLLLDKNVDGGTGFGTSSWDDVFTSNDPNAPIDRETSDRFVILKRGVINVNNLNRNCANLKIYANLKGIHAHFDHPGATGIDTNGPRLILTSDKKSVTVSGTSRLSYYDN